MNVQDVIVCPWGTLVQEGSVLIFFGNARGHLEELNARLPAAIHLLKQVHGDTVVHRAGRDPVACEGDAHWTDQIDIPLGIITADCLPILGFHTSGERICAIHAGWRGVAKQISAKAMQSARLRSSPQKEWSFWIGPHIHFESFEVGMDVAQHILEGGAQKDLSAGAEWLRAHRNPEKTYIDLLSIAKLQLESAGASDIQHLPIDTFTSTDYCSYRRSGKNAGRNISWIMRSSNPESVIHAFRS